VLTCAQVDHRHSSKRPFCVKHETNAPLIFCGSDAPVLSFTGSSSFHSLQLSDKHHLYSKPQLKLQPKMSEAPAVPASANPGVPNILVTEVDTEERGRLDQRRQSSQHSPRRASSPSRGHDRRSGSRYREHHRKHHRPSSPTSSISPPTVVQKKTRRRSDAEPDHTFRGRARNRSRTRSPIVEGENVGVGSGDDERRYRKRSQPPSRHGEEGRGEIRRQRSYPNLYMEDRRDSKDGEVKMHMVGNVDTSGQIDPLQQPENR
jgi:hypothetical protein